MTRCDTCDRHTEHPAQQLCNDCWEVERRLEGYLRRGGYFARNFVESKLKLVEDSYDR